MTLATSRSKHLVSGTQLKSGKYPDGEIYVDVPSAVGGKPVSIIGSTETPAENLLELLLTVDTAKKMGAAKLNLIIPYLGFGKSDSVKKNGRSVGISTVAKLIESLLDKDDKIFTINPHSGKIGTYFKKPLTAISALSLLTREFESLDVEVVSPDEGGEDRAVKFAEILGKKDIIRIHKKRISETEVRDISLKGEVNGKDLVIVDDMVQSGGTIISAVDTLKKRGAGNIYLAIVHMVYSAGGWRKLNAVPGIKKIFTTNTIKPVPDLPSKFKVLDVSSLIEQIVSGSI
jgi:ribose-phosphate pyrophosphokinase